MQLRVHSVSLMKRSCVATGRDEKRETGRFLRYVVSEGMWQGVRRALLILNFGNRLR